MVSTHSSAGQLKNNVHEHVKEYNTFIARTEVQGNSRSTIMKICQ